MGPTRVSQPLATHGATSVMGFWGSKRGHQEPSTSPDCRARSRPPWHHHHHPWPFLSPDACRPVSGGRVWMCLAFIGWRGTRTGWTSCASPPVFVCQRCEGSFLVTTSGDLPVPARGSTEVEHGYTPPYENPQIPKTVYGQSLCKPPVAAPKNAWRLPCRDAWRRRWRTNV